MKNLLTTILLLTVCSCGQVSIPFDPIDFNNNESSDNDPSVSSDYCVAERLAESFKLYLVEIQESDATALKNRLLQMSKKYGFFVKAQMHSKNFERNAYFRKHSESSFQHTISCIENTACPKRSHK